MPILHRGRMSMSTESFADPTEAKGTEEQLLKFSRRPGTTYASGSMSC